MPDEDNFFEIEYRRWFGTSAVSGNALSSMTGLQSLTLLQGTYFDMMVMLITNRQTATMILGFLAMWKDGEQLRFAGAFFFFNAWVQLLDGIGALEYYEKDERKWA